MAAEWLKQALSAACSGFAGYMKQLTEQTKLAAEEKRKYQLSLLERKKQLSYQKPFNISLDAEQLTDIDEQLRYYPGRNSVDLLLKQQQINAIIEHFIHQAMINGDFKLLMAIRNSVIPCGLEFNLFYLRELHKLLFDGFIAVYDCELDYAACTPIGTFFIITADGFGFYYKINMKKVVTLKRYREDFKRFLVTASAQRLLNQYGLKYNRISFDTKTNNLIIFFR